MHNYLKCLLIPLLLFSSSQLAAQTNDNTTQSLLWRITGKGLTKPSYLFGTIHLTDKRLFRHDDSVFAAIDNSEGLAIEINPSELAAYYLNSMLDAADDDKKVSDLMEERELEKYDKFFRKRFGKSAREVTTKDLIKEKNKWVSKYLEEGGMPTFLDAYLYTIANRQGKWTGGIEDVPDQMTIADRTDIKLWAASDEPTSVETMINMYINADLKGIHNLVNKYDSLFKDIMLTRRNIKMARRMDSLAQFRSMFFAVGAAHLPGDSGVVNLLRARGFTLEPVHSTQKTDVEKYVFKNESIDRWEDVTGERDLYTVQMPGVPTSVKLYGLIEMKCLTDFSDMTGYMTMAIVGTAEIKDREDVAEKYAQRVFGKKVRKNKIKKDGIDGYELIDESSKSNLRIQIFITGKVTYIVSASAGSIEKLKTDRMNKYFDSYKIKPLATYARNSYIIVDSALAYRVTSPVNLAFNERLTKQSTTKDWRAKIYSAQDDATGSYVMLTSKCVPPGFYIPNDSIFLADIYAGMSLQCTGTKKDTTIHGYNAMIFTCTQEGGVFMKMLSVVRGNMSLNFALVTNEELKNDEQLNSIFTTLELLPYKPADWQTRTSENNSFSTYAPTPIAAYENTSEETDTKYYSYDSLTATTYHIITDTLNKYTWTDDDSSFLKGKQLEYVEKNVVVLSEKTNINDREKSLDITYKDSISAMHYRLKTIYHNNIIYHLYVVAEKSLLESNNANRFFSEFQVNSKDNHNLHDNKAPQLLNDIKSQDSATAATAILALSKTRFVPKDYPALYATLLDTFPNIAFAPQRSQTTYLVKQKIATIEDTSVISFVKDNYAKSGGRDDVKYNLVSVLAGLHTKESYSTMFQLLAQDPIRDDDVSTLSYNLTDSLPLLLSVYGDVKKLIADTSNISLAASITGNLLDSGLITMQMVKDSAATYIYNTSQVIKNNSHKDDWSWSVYVLLNLLDTINTTEANNVIAEALQAKDIYMKCRAALLLTGKKVDVPTDVWQSIATNIETRSLLYTELKEIGREELFPKQFANQRSMSESEIYSMATDEGEEATVTLLSEKNETIKGNKRKFYLYKISYKGDDEVIEYLGVMGGYDLRGKQLTPEDNYSSVYWKEQYTGDNAEMLFMKYVYDTENEE